MKSIIKSYSQIKRFELLATIICLIFPFIIALNFYLDVLNNHDSSTWKNAIKNVPKSLLKQVISDVGLQRLKSEKSIKVLIISSHGGGQLYLFDYVSPSLCGVNGCLYSMYTKSGRLVLQIIANPYLPPKENLIQVTNVEYEDFPCLLITQNTAIENIVSRTQYCYQDGKYIRFNDALIQP